MSAVDYWQFGAPQVDISPNVTNTIPYIDPEDGEITNSRDWQKNPINGRFNSRFSQVFFAGEVSLMVARIEHYGATGDGSQYGIEKPDNIVIWMNPDLAAEPDVADADVIMDLAEVEARAAEIVAAGGTAMPYRQLNDSNIYSFDRIRLFAGNLSGDRAPADWLVDELRIGETYADVTPYTEVAAALATVPEPGSLLLVWTALGGLALQSRCRR
jgi:hypothetical protein